MIRNLATLFVALAAALGGCSIINAEAPLGSEPVALEGAQLNGVWMLFARQRDRDQRMKEEPARNFFLVHVRDEAKGVAELVVVSPKTNFEDLPRYEVVALRHNDVVFLNFRLRHFKGRPGDPDNEAALMMRAVGVVVVDQWSADEMRVRFLDAKRAKEWAKQGKLPARVLDFDPLREGHTPEEGAQKLLLSRMTAGQLDALTAPAAIADLFPVALREGNKSVQYFARKIPLPQRSRRQE